MSFTRRVASAGRDLTTIGAWAPVRVGYELSRRTPLHRLLFQRLATRPGPGRPVNETLTLPGVDDLSSDARTRTLTDAAAIAEGRVRLFSQELVVGTAPDWHSIVHGTGRWPDRPWWSLELRSADRPGDVKWIWELGRHRHLVVLARAAQVDPHDERWLAVLEAQLRSFIDANPPERGVHWCSSLELALRAFAWLEVLTRTGDRLSLDTRRRMADALWHSGLHILAELPYSLSSMQNNHLLGEAAGLHAIGRALAIPRWEHLGAHLFSRQLERETTAAGATVEESLSYQRFVMDIIALHVLAGGDGGGRAALARGADFLIRLGVVDGPVPQYGDWDEGRALSVVGDPFAFTGVVHLARALGGRPLGPPAPDPDELAWYAPPSGSEPTVRVDAESGGAPIGGGLARAARDDLEVWLRAGPTRWHAHADLCSVSVRLGDEWVIGDPGTGSYNGDDEERAWFRSSAAHAVLELDGRAQVLPHRAFRWQDDPWAAIGPPLHVGSMTVLWGAHRAYGVPVARVIIVQADEIAILDTVSPAESNPREYVLRFPLGPTAAWTSGTIELASGSRVGLHLPALATVAGQPGRWSPTYGSVVPATTVIASGVEHGPLLTALTLRGGPNWQLRGHALHRGGTRVAIRWRGTVISLHLSSPGGSFTRELRTPSPRRPVTSWP